jgi:hypothetical protein
MTSVQFDLIAGDQTPAYAVTQRNEDRLAASDYRGLLALPFDFSQAAAGITSTIAMAQIIRRPWARSAA